MSTPPAATLFEVAHFEGDNVATREFAEELKPEAQAKPSSGITASLALQASNAGPFANLSPPITNAMTIDVEDYFHVSAFADRISSRDWADLPSRVEQNTRRLLTLLAKAEVHATFFVLGWVAERHPQLIRDIARAGHEIGCHSYWHRLVYDLTPKQFRDDTRHAQQLLEEITGDRVTLYRAPSFSITERSLWALDILAELGFEIDSSIYPIRHDCYGIPGADPFPHILSTSAGELREFPGSIYRLGGLSIPVSGGGYFRLYPARVTAWLLDRINRGGQPFMFYVHPWELDPDQPRMTGSLRSRFRHYQNLASTERKLTWLLPKFEFGTMTDSLREQNPKAHPCLAHNSST